jgi:two-component system, response regulator YesN
MWKLNSKKVTRHQLFFRLLLPNILFLALPLIVGFVIYNQTLVVMEKEITGNNMNLLLQTKDTLDRRFTEVGSIARQIVNDTRIIQFQHVTNPYLGTNTYNILETRKSLKDFSFSNNFIYNYFIAFKNSELVLSENSTYGFSEFFDRFQYEGMDKDALKKLLITDYQNRTVLPSHNVSTPGGKLPLITYIQSMGFPGNVQGSVAVTIDNREIQKLQAGLDLSGGGWAYIIDDHGEIVSSLSPYAPSPHLIDRSLLIGNQGSMVQNIDSQAMMITYITSNFNQWTYMVAQPAHVVLEKILYIKKITLTMTFIFLALGILMAYLIAYRNSRPLKRIVETIMERTGRDAYIGSDAYLFIKDSVSLLIDDNHSLEAKMRKQAPLLQAASYERLLKGMYLSSEDTPVLLQHVGIVAEGTYFSTAVLQLRGYDNGINRDALEELDIKRIIVKDIVQQAINNKTEYLHDVAEDQIAILFAFPSENPQVNRIFIEESLQKASEHIYTRLNIATRIAIGGMYEGLLNVSRSFEEAKRTLEYQIWGNRDGLMWFEELPKETSGYYYPSDLEQRLSHLAKAGQVEAVEELLQELHRINFEEKRLQMPMLQFFMNEMWGTIFKLLQQVSINDESMMEQIKPFTGEAGSFEGLENNYRILSSTYKQICTFINDHKKSQNVELLEKIVQLLHETYMHPDLCLEAVADRINISKGYLSQFFKEQTGVNFSEYLENIRMQRAKELLSVTDLPVYEIAERIGYNSSNTFGRAFKRFYGVSTSAFRRF